ncbi:hypothetical protein [Streptomyces sp. NPDC096105]|uniref:hypothetical protein n=1 Tax=Streptomyces sp. NPDC096105 TaxID=3366074 RepID=UPI00382D7222
MPPAGQFLLRPRHRCADPATLAARLFVLHEGAVATRPLSLGTVAAAADLARELVRTAARG